VNLTRLASNLDRRRGATHRLGLTDEEARGLPYGHHWRPEMADLAPHVLQAVAAAPVAAELLPPMARAVLDIDGAQLPSACTVSDDGAMHVHLRTSLPGVTPEMVDWWFGWHSDEPQRYKLWHPRAHVHAEWLHEPSPGSRGRERYVGSTSIVEEYLGAKSGRYAISFRAPEELGIVDSRLADPSVATAICARIGLADVPVDAGWLTHLVIADEAGSVMHSRFWIGGPYAAGRDGSRVDPLVKVARRFVTPNIEDARALMVHCAQEMTHLAAFLPELHRERT
jgi:hypothetical protein